jgi:hypothetical protein
MSVETRKAEQSRAEQSCRAVRGNCAHRHAPRLAAAQFTLPSLEARRARLRVEHPSPSPSWPGVPIGQAELTPPTCAAYAAYRIAKCEAIAATLCQAMTPGAHDASSLLTHNWGRPGGPLSRAPSRAKSDLEWILKSG